MQVLDSALHFCLNEEPQKTSKETHCCTTHRQRSKKFVSQIAIAFPQQLLSSVLSPLHSLRSRQRPSVRNSRSRWYHTPIRCLHCNANRYLPPLQCHQFLLLSLSQPHVWRRLPELPSHLPIVPLTSQNHNQSVL